MASTWFSLEFEENRTKLFSEQEETPEFHLWWTLSVTMATLAMLFHFGFMVVVLRVKNVGKNANVHRRKNRKLLVLNLSCSWITELILVVALTTTTGWSTCSLIGRLPAPFYVLANFCTYLTLMQRLQAVQGKMFTSAFDGYLTSTVKLGTLSLPLLAVSCILIFEGKQFFSSMRCVQTISSFIAWILTVLSSFLNLGYLILFLRPVMKHIQAVDSLSDGQGRPSSGKLTGAQRDSLILKQMARRNLILSIAAMLSTMIHMSVTSYVGGVLEQENTPAVAHLIFTEYVSGPLDLVVNSSVSLALLKSCWWTSKVKVSPSSNESK